MSNNINIKHGRGIASRSPNSGGGGGGSTTQTGTNADGSSSPNTNALYAGDGTIASEANNPNGYIYSFALNAEDSDPSNSYWDQFLNFLTNLYETIGNNLPNLKCPGNQIRGWRFFHDGNFIDLAPCGCYREALWPNLLSIPAGWKAGAKAAAKKLVKKARKKLTSKTLRIIGTAIKELELDFYDGIKLLNNTSHLKRKIPPVPNGYVRLYRGQGARRLQRRVRGQNFDIKSTQRSPDIEQLNDPNGYFWTSKEDLAQKYAIVGTTEQGIWLPDLTPESEVFYIDIPWQDALNANLKDSPVLGLLPGQKRIADKSIKSFYDPTLNEFIFPKDFKMPLRRRNPSTGIIEIVEDWPNSKIDIELNPGVFVWNDSDGAIEFFLDSPLNGTNFLAQVSSSNNMYKEAKLVALAGLKEKTRSLYQLYTNLLNCDETMDLSYMGKLVDDISTASDELFNKIDEIYDVYVLDPDDLNIAFGPFARLKNNTIKSTLMRDTYVYFIGLITLINGMLSVVTVVENKYCGPKDSFYKTFSNIPGSTFSLPEKLRNLKNEDWDDIRNQLIEEDAKTIWAEFDEDCECKSCPETWNLCTSVTYDCFNTCIKCTESTSNDTETILYGSGLYAEPIPYEAFEPVYAEHSKVPIILSHKSTQLLFGPNAACNCWCPISHISRLDKNGQNTILGNRILRDDISQTCLTYTHGKNKTTIFVPGSQREHDNFEPLIIEPRFGLKIPGIPFETIKLDQVCDLAEAPDGLLEYSIIPWVTTSAYKWSDTLGRWTCKQTKECESPQVFTEGVGDNNEYCDCVTIEDNSSSSSSSSLSSMSSQSSQSSQSSISSQSSGAECSIDPPTWTYYIYCDFDNHVEFATVINDDLVASNLIGVVKNNENYLNYILSVLRNPDRFSCENYDWDSPNNEFLALKCEVPNPPNNPYSSAYDTITISSVLDDSGEKSITLFNMLKVPYEPIDDCLYHYVNIGIIPKVDIYEDNGYICKPSEAPGDGSFYITHPLCWDGQNPPAEEICWGVNNCLSDPRPFDPLHPENELVPLELACLIIGRWICLSGSCEQITSLDVPLAKQIILDWRDPPVSLGIITNYYTHETEQACVDSNRCLDNSSSSSTSSMSSMSSMSSLSSEGDDCIEKSPIPDIYKFIGITPENSYVVIHSGSLYDVGTAVDECGTSYWTGGGSATLPFFKNAVYYNTYSAYQMRLVFQGGAEVDLGNSFTADPWETLSLDWTYTSPLDPSASLTLSMSSCEDATIISSSSNLSTFNGGEWAELKNWNEHNGASDPFGCGVYLPNGDVSVVINGDLTSLGTVVSVATANNCTVSSGVVISADMEIHGNATFMSNSIISQNVVISLIDGEVTLESGAVNNGSIVNASAVTFNNATNNGTVDALLTTFDGSGAANSNGATVVNNATFLNGACNSGSVGVIIGDEPASCI